MKVSIGKYNKNGADRKIKVKIDDYDVWSLDNTLAHIIHPALIRLRDVKHGSPTVLDEDVPEHLRADNENDVKVHDRWTWVLNEMIWAFGQELIDWEDQFHAGEHDLQFEELPDGNYEMKRGPKDTHVFDAEGYRAHNARIQNGFRLFGTYYSGLWD
jgi:hypothetical protein